MRIKRSNTIRNSRKNNKTQMDGVTIEHKLHKIFKLTQDIDPIL